MNSLVTSAEFLFTQCLPYVSHTAPRELISSSGRKQGQAEEQKPLHK